MSWRSCHVNKRSASLSFALSLPLPLTVSLSSVRHVPWMLTNPLGLLSKHPFKSNHLRVVCEADSCAHFTCKSRTFQRKTRMGKKEGWLRVSDIPASQCLMAHHPAMWHLQNIGEFPPCLHYGNGVRETLMRTYGWKAAGMTLWACFEKYCAIICHVLVFIK